MSIQETRDKFFVPGARINDRMVVHFGPNGDTKLVGVGDEVYVHAFGHWYVGRVVSVGRTNLKVRYTTGTGITRDKSVNAASKGLVRATGAVDTREVKPQ